MTFVPASKDQQTILDNRDSLTFSFADVTTKSLYDQNSNEKKTSVTDDIVKELARNVLEVPLFSSIQLQRPNFDAVTIIHLIK